MTMEKTSCEHPEAVDYHYYFGTEKTIVMADMANSAYDVVMREVNHLISQKTLIKIGRKE